MNSEAPDDRRQKPFDRDEADRLRKATYAAIKSGKALKDLSTDHLLVLFADVGDELGGREQAGQSVSLGRLQFVSRRILGR